MNTGFYIFGCHIETCKFSSANTLIKRNNHIFGIKIWIILKPFKKVQQIFEEQKVPFYDKSVLFTNLLTILKDNNDIHCYFYVQEPGQTVFVGPQYYHMGFSIVMENKLNIAEAYNMQPMNLKYMNMLLNFCNESVENKENDQSYDGPSYCLGNNKRDMDKIKKKLSDMKFESKY